VGRIGERAGVVTSKADGKYAGCHDLRRGFGTRWARKVMPAVLRRLMRHASISTTMSYYVDLDAADVARELQAQFGGKAAESAAPSNTPGNTPQFCPPPVVRAGDLNPLEETGCK
jgi:hypothetical protein